MYISGYHKQPSKSKMTAFGLTVIANARLEEASASIVRRAAISLFASHLACT